MPRRGITKLWSTSFHLDTAVPDLTTFELLADALATGGTHQLMQCFWNDQELVGIDYYAAGSDIASHSKTYAEVGYKTHSTDTIQSSDSVALWRWATTARTSKNHPVYLFNYMHGVRSTQGAATDAVDSNQHTDMDAYANRLVTGVSAGGLTFKRAGPNGAVAQSVLIETYIHHRDFRK